MQILRPATRCSALATAICVVIGPMCHAEISVNGQFGDDNISLIYRPSNGQLWMDTNSLSLTTMEITSIDEVFLEPDPLPFSCSLIVPCWSPSRIIRLDPLGFRDFEVSQRAESDLSVEQLSTWSVAGVAADGGSISSQPEVNTRIVDLQITGDLGDLNGNGDLDVSDLDIMTSAVRDTRPLSVFDLNQDELVDAFDRSFWIHDLANTWLGDANLDGEFNSGDLVGLFAAGEYEDDFPMNSTWATGDFDGDGDFASGDLVAAFADGGYEQGPRDAVNAVPEPTDSMLLLIGLAGLAMIFNARRRYATGLASLAHRSEF